MCVRLMQLRPVTLWKKQCRQRWHKRQETKGRAIQLLHSVGTNISETEDDDDINGSDSARYNDSKTKIQFLPTPFSEWEQQETVKYITTLTHTLLFSLPCSLLILLINLVDSSKAADVNNLTFNISRTELLFRVNQTRNVSNEPATTASSLIQKNNNEFETADGDYTSEYIFDRTDIRIIFIILYTLVFCCCFFGK
ncbi:hypothetical protein KR215_008688 [Drosophila sulfurigaster]|nr:hypothetical protein KR215_008688 [Drosophila sulfurigaster]